MAFNLWCDFVYSRALGTGTVMDLPANRCCCVCRSSRRRIQDLPAQRKVIITRSVGVVLASDVLEVISWPYIQGEQCANVTVE
jgi:hypothetical protein